MHICPAVVAKDLSTSDFEQCFRLSSGPRARLEKNESSKMRPRGAQDEAKMGSLEASGRLGPWVLSWGGPGWSWALLGALRAGLGAVLGAAPGAHLGLPGGSAWSFLGLG